MIQILLKHENEEVHLEPQTVFACDPSTLALAITDQKALIFAIPAVDNKDE